MSPTLNQNAVSVDYINREQSSKVDADFALFERIGAGDERALAELYHRYRVILFQFLLRLVQERAAAEEILQDVMLAAWQRAAEFRQASSVKTWLYRVAYYRASTWLRNKKPDTYTDTASMPSDDDALDDLMIQRWQASQVQEALDGLNPHQRTAIELIFYHEFSYRETAEILNCPTGTVKSRVSHALRALQLVLETRFPLSE
jgi:RNA polymerase sigma-70 factor (ECF subfamily)